MRDEDFYRVGMAAGIEGLAAVHAAMLRERGDVPALPDLSLALAGAAVNALRALRPEMPLDEPALRALFGGWSTAVLHALAVGGAIQQEHVAALEHELGAFRRLFRGPDGAPLSA